MFVLSTGNYAICCMLYVGDTPKYTPFISRLNNPLILTIDPNFQPDILVHLPTKNN